MAIQILAGIGISTALLAFIKKLITPIVVVVMQAIGLSFVTFIGLNIVVNLIKDSIYDLLNDIHTTLPAVLQILGILQVDVFVEMLFAAGIVKMTMKGAFANARTPSWAKTL